MNELKKETWQELKNMVEKASAAYIAAVAEDGFPSIKAVFAAKGSDGMKTFWFSTNLSAQRTQLFIKNPKACVYFCDPERSLALSMKGNIRVRTDREARERIWEDGDEQYYTEGMAVVFTVGEKNSIKGISQKRISRSDPLQQIENRKEEEL